MQSYLLKKGKAVCIDVLLSVLILWTEILLTIPKLHMGLNQ